MKSVYGAVPAPLKSLALSAYFSLAIPRGSGFRSLITFRQDDSCWSHEAVLERDGDRLVIALDYVGLLGDRRRINSFWKRLPIMISLFAATDRSVRRAMVDISDGGEVREGRMCFCSNRDDTYLVPDRHFLKSGGYRRYRAVAAAHRDNWRDRKDLVLWRGNLSGGGLWPTSADDIDNPGTNHRWRMCMLLRDVPGVDAKLSFARTSLKNRRRPDFDALRAFRVYGDYVPQKEWVHVKYALDIDGNTNAWVNFFVRLILGCCVIKVASRRGYRQWYYDDLVPWRHFVPVAADMSDLVEKIEWCRAHDAECAKIAAGGQDFALARTVETERAATIARLNAALGE